MTEEEGSLTVAILREIRDEIRGTREELGAGIGATNTRLDRTNTRLDAVVQEQIRQSTAMVELREQLRTDMERLGLRIENVMLGPMGQLVRDHETRIRRLERQKKYRRSN